MGGGETMALGRRALPRLRAGVIEALAVNTPPTSNTSAMFTSCTTTYCFNTYLLRDVQMQRVHSSFSTILFVFFLPVSYFVCVDGAGGKRPIGG